jgi:hypothetical protein
MMRSLQRCSGSVATWRHAQTVLLSTYAIAVAIQMMLSCNYPAHH